MNIKNEEKTVYTVVDLTGNPTNDQWEVRKFGIKKFEGKFRSVVFYCVNGLGFSLNDFDKAVSALCYNSHDVLEFNAKRHLIATSKRIIGSKGQTG